MTKVSWFVAIVGIGMATGAAGSPADTGCAAKAPAYPTFCAIPATPSDIRDAGAFHAAVIATRMAGARLIGDNAAARTPEGEGTETFATESRAMAAYPTSDSSRPVADSDAFAKDARRLAAPPAQPKR